MARLAKFTVCVPWRPSPSRLRPYERMLAHWDEFFPRIPIVTADSDTEIFSLSQARNNAVRKAPTELCVINDADSLPDPANIRRAIAEAAADPLGICWPFKAYRTIDQKYLDVPFAELAGVPYINTWDGEGIEGVGGCLVAAQGEYWRLGGSPPEFIGWGHEDTAFTAVVKTLSHARRIPGKIYSFEHNTGAQNYIGAKADSPGWDRDGERNQALLEPYRAGNGRPWLMREILRRRDAGKMWPYVGYAGPPAP